MLRFFSIILFLVFNIYLPAQTTTIYDGFEGNGTVMSWVGDDCLIQTDLPNPFQQEENQSSTVLAYEDQGGQYANVRFEVAEPLDLSLNQVFSLKIYLPSDGMTGNQPLQVSLKLQDGNLLEPWSTQSEIIKPIIADQWQTVIFDFTTDEYINLNAGSPPPVTRTDFNRVVIQVNGENNNDEVIAYIDEVSLQEREDVPTIYTELVWSDEFENEGAIDPEKWFAQTRIPNGESWFNGEIQHYTDRLDNAYVADGSLHILAKRENYTNQGVTKGFTSARLNSKFAFTYGRVEVRAKLPSGIGTWPAIWMLGQNINENGAYWEIEGFGTTGWPACGEIDIMEHWGDNQDYISSALHTPSSFGNTMNVGGRILPGASDEFHTYEAEWSPDKIVFSVDGVVHYTYEPEVQNEATWPFTAPQYLIFNIAILPIIASDFTSSELEIDYVRVFQEEPSSSEVVMNSENLRYYPNPVRDHLIIELSENIGEPIELRLIDSSGKILINRLVQSESSQLVFDRLGHLTPGIYFIHYELNGQQYQLRLLKQ